MTARTPTARRRPTRPCGRDRARRRGAALLAAAAPRGHHPPAGPREAPGSDAHRRRHLRRVQVQAQALPHRRPGPDADPARHRALHRPAIRRHPLRGARSRHPPGQHRLRLLLPALPRRPLPRRRGARTRRLQRGRDQPGPLDRRVGPPGPGLHRRPDPVHRDTGLRPPRRAGTGRLPPYVPARAGALGRRRGGRAQPGPRRSLPSTPEMPRLELDSAFTPTADQPKAIDELAEGVQTSERFTTLLGATGTGKTMTMAGVIERVQKPALVIAHNKTLAAQLCNELRTFFPRNAVEYFVSYYDYYQPEAYVPSRDLYIEKDSAINQEIDRLRHA